jgi:hypothetical protein
MVVLGRLLIVVESNTMPDKIVVNQGEYPGSEIRLDQGLLSTFVNLPQISGESISEEMYHEVYNQYTVVGSASCSPHVGIFCGKSEGAVHI